jgi:hypothetical protein
MVTSFRLGAIGPSQPHARPPPFSSMNSTPAFSKARRIDASFAWVAEISPSMTSTPHQRKLGSFCQKVVWATFGVRPEYERRT